MKKIILLLALLIPLIGFSQVELPFGVKVLTNKPADFTYGPYASLAAARTAIPLALRYDGMTVQITGLGNYQWLSGDFSNSGLIPKTVPGDLHQGANTLTQALGVDGHFPFKIGDVTPLSEYKVSVIGFPTTTTSIGIDVNGNVAIDGAGAHHWWMPVGGSSASTISIGDGTQSLAAFQATIDPTGTNYINFGSGQNSSNNGTFYSETTIADVPTIRMYAAYSGVTRKLEFSGADAILDLGSDATGDTYYRNGSGKLVRRAIGSTGDVLTVSGGLPVWSAGGGGGVSFPLSSSQLVINNPAATFAYTFTAAAIAANRTITLPLLAGNDVMVTAAFAQTLTNKTLGSGTVVTTATTGTSDTAPASNAFVQQEIIANTVALPLTLANGGLNASVTASNGGIFYSTATAGAILSGTATANKPLVSGSSTTPAWAGYTIPSSLTTGDLPYASSSSVLNKLTIGSTGDVLTVAGGVPTWSAPGGGTVATSAEALTGTNNTHFISPLKNAEVNAKVYNVRSATYGAKGNGRTGLAGTTASGSANLTCTDCAFVATDAGAYIKVSGAGAAGVDFVGTILTYTDATHIVLSANASTTVSGTATVLYGNDDTAGFQAAINAADAAGGGLVYVPKPDLGNEYIIAGAIQTTVGGIGCNCQIYIPYHTYTGPNVTTIELVGEVAPSFKNETVTGGGPTLHSTLITSLTRGRVLGAVGEPGFAASFNYSRIIVKNLHIRVRSKTGATHVSPQYTAFGFGGAAIIQLENCLADTESTTANPALPTNTTAIGFELPFINNSTEGDGELKNCSAIGFYKGFEMEEHITLRQCNSRLNYFGYAVQNTSFNVHAVNIQVTNCKYNLVFEGAATVNIEGLNMENTTSGGAWYQNTADFYAPSSVTCYGRVTFSKANNTVVKTGTFGTNIFFINIREGLGRQIAGGGAMFSGGSNEWDGSEDKQVFQIIGSSARTDNIGYGQFDFSQQLSGTAHALSRIGWRNSSISSANKFLGQIFMYTNGAIDKGIFRISAASGSGTVPEIALWSSDRIDNLVSTRFRAGTATAGTYPWIMQSGTSLTTPVAGVGEFTTDDLFFTITTGTARKRLLMADAVGGLTSGTVPMATTNGRLADSGITFASNTYTVGAGTKVLFAGSGSGLSSWGAPHGTAPSSPINGDFWTTTAGPFMQINAVTWTLSSDNVASTISAVKTFTAKPIVPTPTGGTEATNKNYVDNAITAAATDGTYTPTLTNTTNVAASTAYVTGYYRVGNSITVYGKIDIDATLAASTATEMGISLPVASDLAAEEDLGGSAVSDAVASLTARIKADFANNRASVVFKALSLTNDSYGFEFSYQVK